MATKAQSVDKLSLIGILLSMVAVIGGNLLEGGSTDSLIQLTAFIIVFGGTLGATLVQMPQKVFLHGIKRARWVFLPPNTDSDAMRKKIVAWSRISRKEGLLGLQKAASKENDLFARKGLRLLVDGNEPSEISKILEVEIDSISAAELNAARVYDAMGGYSPTIGIIGAVLGLIQVMNNLADPSALGPGIAVAFVATIYGVGFANFLFLPMSNKLKAICSERTHYHEMVLEGMVSIAEGENPMAISSKLQSFKS
ncbi:MAG: flagellar motor protein [Halioglobus sp.]